MVAYETEIQARRNIEAKLRVLDSELKRAQVAGLLALPLPTSQRQFNEWIPKVAGGNSARNSQATLRKHEDLYESVKVAVEAAKRLSRATPETPSRIERVASLRRTLHLHKAIRQIAESEMVRLRAQLKTARRELDVRSGQLKSAQNEIGRLRDELASLEVRTADLLKTLATLRPIRRA